MDLIELVAEWQSASVLTISSATDTTLKRCSVKVWNLAVTNLVSISQARGCCVKRFIPLIELIASALKEFWELDLHKYDSARLSTPVPR